MSSIIKAISSIMADVGSVSKAGTNSFHNYKFTTASDILHKLQPLMAREGLVVFQTEKNREMLMEGSVLAVTYEFSLAHKDGEVWPTPVVRTGMTSARNSKGGFDDKALNKCHTSAHKYFHLTLFEIPTGDYDDADADEDKPVAKAEATNGKRTMKEISANKTRKETDYQGVVTDISQLETEVALDGYVAKVLTPEFMSGLGSYNFQLEEVLERKRREFRGEVDTAPAPSNEPTTKAAYVQEAHEIIANAPDGDRLRAWWTADVHARTRFRLNNAEAEDLKARCAERVREMDAEAPHGRDKGGRAMSLLEAG